MSGASEAVAAVDVVDADDLAQQIKQVLRDSDGSAIAVAEFIRQHFVADADVRDIEAERDQSRKDAAAFASALADVHRELDKQGAMLGGEPIARIRSLVRKHAEAVDAAKADAAPCSELALRQAIDLGAKHEATVLDVSAILDGLKAPAGETIQARILALAAKKFEPVRVRLPDERKSVTTKFKVGRQKGYLTVGEYADGRPGEVFIRVEKPPKFQFDQVDSDALGRLAYEEVLRALDLPEEVTRAAESWREMTDDGRAIYLRPALALFRAGVEAAYAESDTWSMLRGLTDAVAILTSLLLQHGVAIEEIAGKLVATKFEPSGPTEDAVIRRATSVLDYVFRKALSWYAPEASCALGDGPKGESTS